jgi:hypothetical protein
MIRAVPSIIYLPLFIYLVLFPYKTMNLSRLKFLCHLSNSHAYFPELEHVLRISAFCLNNWSNGKIIIMVPNIM